MKATEDLIHEHSAIKVMLSIMSRIADQIRDDRKIDTGDVDQILGFLSTFTDKCHHGKEETVFFPALVSAGVRDEQGPVGVMLHEHEIGRKLVEEIGTALEQYKNGQPGEVLADSMLHYVHLLQGHMQKEEMVLFPMADRILGAGNQHVLYEEFGKIEEEVVGHGVHERYHHLLDQLKKIYMV